jgi:hypothetical protein
MPAARPEASARMSRTAETLAPPQALLSRSVWTSVAIFIGAFALIVFRDPSLFYAPRFWAEEATVYLTTAYSSPVWVTLITPHQGYLSLWTNVAGLLATIPPLEYAPAVTTAMALIVYLAIIVAILVSESEALDTPLKKAVASLAAIVIGTGENWLTSTNSQHILPLLVFLILIDNKENPAKRRCWYVAAAIAGLSGPESNFLTPLFLLRFWLKRERADLVLFLIMACTALIEVSYIAYTTLALRQAANFLPTQERLSFHVNPVLVLAEVVHFGMAYPLFGFTPPMSALVKAASIVSAALLALAIFLARSRMRALILFPLAALILTLLSVFGSFSMQGGARYAYTPSVIVSMLLLALCTDVRLPTAARALPGALLVASLAYWCATYRSSLIPFDDPSWPRWSAEVKAWRADPTKDLQVWPVWQTGSANWTFWRIKLPPAAEHSAP